MHGHLNVKYILLNPCNTVFPEKLTGFQLLNKFPAFTRAHLDNTTRKNAER